MKKPDPVVALLTAGGKKLWLPDAVLGAMEDMLADPDKKYGVNRLGIFRAGMVFLRETIDDREYRQRAEERHQAAIEALGEEPGHVPHREPGRMAAEMEPTSLAELDASLSRALEIAIPEALRGGDLYFLLLSRLNVAKAAHAERKEAP